MSEMLNIKSTFNEYPSKFWILVGARFIDALGGTMVMPFFALYLTAKFNIGMTQAGVILGLFSVAGMVGSMFGGGLADKFGRRTIVLAGLVISALSSLSFGLVNNLAVFYPLALGVGLFSNMAGPAHGAMVADILPEEKRAEGFGILRVSGNLAWIIGPTLGGFFAVPNNLITVFGSNIGATLATNPYLFLFSMDAVTSVITAIIVYLRIPETKPQVEESDQAAESSMLETFKGYFKVLSDSAYVSFIVTTTLMTLVYLQLYSTFSVYLRDVHAIEPDGYGALMSMNAFMVVLLQFWVTRRVSTRPPLLMMGLGTAFYMVGFTLFGIVSSWNYFAVAMLLVTIGEMIVIPVSQSLVAAFAPEDMRGRYMAIFGLSWGIPQMIGPSAAGLIMDNIDPYLVWYLCGLVSAVALIGFYILHVRTRQRIKTAEAETPPLPSAG
jgi:MFS family permease